MADYKGNTCPVCDTKFKEGDDVVVCPDCGTPYHRACWQKIGVCVHEDEHAAGFEWKPDFVPGGAEDLVCANCGTHNPLSAKFCNHCGVPLPEPGAAPTTPDAPRPIYANGQSGAAPYAGRNPHVDTYTADASGVYRRELGPDDPIGSIKARDLASYVGHSGMYYLVQFLRIHETKHKAVVSFSAFLFGPAYFFYRKMWKEAAIFTLVDLVLMIPSVLYLMALSGAALVSGLSLGSWLPMAMNVCAVVNWAQMVLRGLFAIYWYKKDCTARILAIYDQVPDGPERQDALAMRGGTSVVAVLLYCAAYTALIGGLTLLMGPNISNVISALTM